MNILTKGMFAKLNYSVISICYCFLTYLIVLNLVAYSREITLLEAAN